LYLLYVFFELSVFPIVVMILGFGNQIEKVRSSYYLFFYSFFCSVPFVLVLFNMDYFFFFLYFRFFFCWEVSFFVCLFFIMKFPVYFLHFWLPKAHVEAPTRASMILAGLLLKLGTGGFVRLLFLLKGCFGFFFFFVSFLGMVLCRVFCFFQRDTKSLSAYSSVNHMSFLLLLLLLLGGVGNNGALLVMVSHGFVSVLIFFLVGELYHVRFSRNIYFLGGVFCGNVVLLFVFLLTWLFNRGVPLSLRFFGEFFGIRACLFSCFFFFFFLALYFFNSLYYSLFFLVTGLMGKIYSSFLFWKFFFC